MSRLRRTVNVREALPSLCHSAAVSRPIPEGSRRAAAASGDGKGRRNLRRPPLLHYAKYTPKRVPSQEKNGLSNEIKLQVTGIMTFFLSSDSAPKPAVGPQIPSHAPFLPVSPRAPAHEKGRRLLRRPLLSAYKLYGSKRVPGQGRIPKNVCSGHFSVMPGLVPLLSGLDSRARLRADERDQSPPLLFCHPGLDPGSR